MGFAEGRGLSELRFYVTSTGPSWCTLVDWGMVGMFCRQNYIEY